jgi:site-specific recombinase XerD
MEMRPSKSLCFSGYFKLEKHMHHLIDEYLNFMAVEKGASRNTIDAYSRDLNRYAVFIDSLKIHDISQIGTEDLISYLAWLKGKGLAANSVNRALAALRGFYKYLLREKKLESTPVAHIELARVWMHLPDVLSREEMNLLLMQPGSATPAAIRDTAMLELIYATGIRVSELTGLTLNSINWQVGYLVAMGKGGKERIVPLGRTAYDQVKRYIEGDDAAGILEDREKVCGKSEYCEESSSPYLPALLCHPSAGGGGRSAFGADHAGSCRYLDHPDLHARDAGTVEGDSPEVPSTGMKELK